MAVTSGTNGGVVKSTTRNVTDIGHYKRVEYSHLHEAGGKSEKTRFLEKIKKLEEAADVKAKMGTVAEVHKAVEKPPGWKPVKLPNKVDKGAIAKSKNSVPPNTRYFHKTQLKNGKTQFFRNFNGVDVDSALV